MKRRIDPHHRARARASKRVLGQPGNSLLDLSERLRAWRQKAGISQAAAAALLRVPVGSVENWEQGRYVPDPLALDGLLSRMQLACQTSA
jgi:DNA-binding transcriptional regulator YiaG